MENVFVDHFRGVFIQHCAQLLSRLTALLSPVTVNE